MHSLVLCAVFGFTLAVALLVAARRPLAASAVVVAGVGWPATLSGGSAIAFGTAALAAALAIPLVLRASSLRTLVAGTAIAALVVVGAASASSVTTLGRDAALDWESWDLRGPAREASAVRFVWDSNYSGITFPPTKTIVLRVEGPTLPNYWRTTTLDLVSDNHWSEDLFWLDQVDGEKRALQLPQLVPARAAKPVNWLEQTVQVEALVDDHLAAAGTPVGLDASRFGTVFQLSGGVLRVRDPVRAGQRYRVWSYAPDPSPRALAAAPFRTPPAATRFLEVDGRVFPDFATPQRERAMQAFLRDPSYVGYGWHRTLYDVAHRVTGKATTQYGAVLALESWFRQTGGFRYDESPPRTSGPPLVDFVTRTKAGYCQHFAGAMALMLRLLGIPARVAVGFTSGTRDGDAWVVTDHDAHAWVEVWFAGPGWIPFDPTPGRGTLGGDYTFASGSQAAVAALRRGQLSGEAPARSTPPDVSDLGLTTVTPAERAPWLVGIGLALAAVWMLVVGIGKTVRRRLRVSVAGSEAGGDCQPPGARGIPAGSGRRRRGEHDAGLAATRGAPRARSRVRRLRNRGRACALRAAGERRAGLTDGTCRASETARGSPSRPVHLGPLPRVRVAPVAPVRRVGVSETYDLFQLGRSHLRNGMPAQATVPLEKAKRNEPTHARSARRSASRTSGSGAGRRPSASSAHSSSSTRRTSSRTTRSAERS